MAILYQRCCGRDGHQATVVACVRLPGKGRRRASEVRTFETTPAALLQLADWLTEQGGTYVAMESMGGSWQPVCNILEGSCTAMLVNAQHAKTVPGRKTDAKDCAGLAELVALGVLRASFIPPQPIRELRELTRSRKTVVQERPREVNRVPKLLASANLKLGLVATAILGGVGAGDPAGAGGGRARGGGGGRVGQRAAALQPSEAHVEHVQTMPGGNREAAERWRAEMGVDMRRFPAAAHLASWAGVCPGQHASAGKRKTGRTRPGNPWPKPLLVECGWGAGCARRTALGTQYARLGRRLGKKKAALAGGHRILVAAYHILRDGVPYQDRGLDHCDRLATDRLTRHDVGRLEQLGHHVALAPDVNIA